MRCTAYVRTHVKTGASRPIRGKKNSTKPEIEQQEDVCSKLIVSTLPLSFHVNSLTLKCIRAAKSFKFRGFYFSFVFAEITQMVLGLEEWQTRG